MGTFSSASTTPDAVAGHKRGLTTSASGSGGSEAAPEGKAARDLARQETPAGSPESAIYLYGISRQLGRRGLPSASGSVRVPASVKQLKGVDGSAPVEALPCEGLVCWISRVGRREFGDDLVRNMENLDWLAAAGTRHQAALAAIARAGDVLPLRLGVIFLAEESLYEHVRQRKHSLESDFKRLAGCDEWGVKVFQEGAARSPKPARGSVKEISGSQYLRAKSANLAQRARPGGAAGNAWAADSELRLFASSLEKLARARTEGGKIAAGRRDLLFQAALLVPRARQRKLERLIRQYSRKWAGKRRIDCSGPWPAYSFVSREEAGTETDHGV